MVLVASCGSDTLSLEGPSLDGDAASACADLVEALPDSVSDQPRKRVTVEDGYVAAWGDPPIVLTCGVPQPEGFDRFASCQQTNGVGWYVPEEQISDQSIDVEMTTIGFRPNVEVVVPAGLRPPAAAMVDLAPAIKTSIREVDPCV